MIFAKKVHINLQMWIFFCTFASRIENHTDYGSLAGMT